MINKTSNGASVNGAPLTTVVTNEAAPGLLRNAIDERIAKIRPMATPIDQLSRCAGSRHCGAMKVEYYSVDVKPVTAKLTKDVTSSDVDDSVNEDQPTLYIKTDADAIFSPSETLMVSESAEYTAMFYVISIDRTNGVFVAWVNPRSGDDGYKLPPMGTGTNIVRMGRAATELDVQTSQFEALPQKKTNNCQIFKMQVEQSTFQKLANKEVGWNFSDQEEVAVIDMRQGMEKNYIFGQLATIVDPVKHEEVYLTGGIWNQTDKTFRYDPSTLDTKKLVDLSRQAFTGAGGSNRKILIGGSGLIEALSKVSYDKTVDAGQTFVKWGIEFKEIRSNFGSLYVLHSEIFDQCGHADDGFVLDPDCLTKYCHVPFHAEKLDLRRSGVRNTDAIVLTEASCLVLRHPEAHMRIVKQSN